MNRTTTALAFCTAAPLVGWIINTAWPAPTYGYRIELALLVVLGVAALWLSKETQTGAVFLYCTFALLSVAALLEHYSSYSGPLVAAPFLGIVLVTLLTRDKRAVVGYGLVSLVAYCAGGILSDDVGLGGVLAFFSAVLTACAAWWVQDCNLKAQLKAVQEQTKQVERGVRYITGALDGYSKTAGERERA